MPKHELTFNEQNQAHCTVCGHQWVKKNYIPISDCPGVKVYEWGKWGNLMTKKQLYDAGYQTGTKLPAPAGACYREKSPDGIMWLYDPATAVKRAEPSEAQKAALAKAQHQAAIVSIVCHYCHQDIVETTRKKSARWGDKPICRHCGDKSDAIEWAREMLAKPDEIRILDTETTGLYGAEIVEIAVIDGHGNVLLNRRVKPSPEGLTQMVTPGGSGVCASDIHGITPELLANEPSFAAIYPELRTVLTGKELIIYNAGYDAPILRDEVKRIDPDYDQLSSDVGVLGYIECHCAMELYAAYYGEVRWERGRGWNEWNWSYRWQKLSGGDHSALGDCQATLRLINGMAANTQFDDEGSK